MCVFNLWHSILLNLDKIKQPICVLQKGLVLLSELFSLAPLLFSFLKAASQSPDCGEYYFLLGQLYWDMGEETRKDRSKAHTHLLKVSTVIIENVKLLVGKGHFISLYIHINNSL